MIKHTTSPQPDCHLFLQINKIEYKGRYGSVIHYSHVAPAIRGIYPQTSLWNDDTHYYTPKDKGDYKHEYCKIFQPGAQLFYVLSRDFSHIRPDTNKKTGVTYGRWLWVRIFPCNDQYEIDQLRLQLIASINPSQLPKKNKRLSPTLEDVFEW